MGGSDATQTLTVNPTVQVTYSKTHIEYSRPVALNRFNLYPVQKELGWIEVKRKSWEFGLGLAALIKNTVTLGLIPYKGSIQTIIRNKESQEEKSLPFKLPESMHEIEQWSDGDSGVFQTYGGIQAYVGVSAGFFNVATSSLGIQNQFILEIRKTTKDSVTLSITEESLNRRQLLLGPMFAYGTMANFDGQRFSIEFNLNPRNNTHHELYQEALKGNIMALQEALDGITEQRLSWKGSDRSFYYGIPMLAGKTKIAGNYEIVEDDFEAEVDISGQRSNGVFRKLKNLNQYVYQTDESMVVIWTSEMNKVKNKEFEKNFFSKGRIMGVKGFNRTIPENTSFGSVVSQIGFTFSKAEVESLKSADMNELVSHLHKRCSQERLSCWKPKVIRGMMAELKKYLAQPWTDLRSNLGRLLIKEPALVYSIVKTLKLEKEVYFKFLSEKFQSMEGSEVIAI